jgi:hypothetical protein
VKLQTVQIHGDTSSSLISGITVLTNERVTRYRKKWKRSLATSSVPFVSCIEKKSEKMRPKFAILHTRLTAMFSCLKFRKKSGEISDNFKKILMFISDVSNWWKWSMTDCNTVDGYQCFGWIYCLCLQCISHVDVLSTLFEIQIIKDLCKILLYVNCWDTARVIILVNHGPENVALRDKWLRPLRDSYTLYHAECNCILNFERCGQLHEMYHALLSTFSCLDRLICQVAVNVRISAARRRQMRQAFA